MSVTMPDNSWVGHTVAGGYQIVKLLDEGGFSRVYIARSPGVLANKLVVVKAPLLQHIRAAEDRQRWDREIQALVACENIRGVPSIIHSGEHCGTPFYVCQYIAGGNLETRLRSHDRLECDDHQLPLAEMLRILSELARILDAVHRLDHVHRDVKPKNILFSTDGDLFLTDFGLTRKAAADHRVTAKEEYIGTKHYSSLNQLYSYEPVPADDLHSLAVLAYRLLCRRLPFPQDNLFEIVDAVKTGAPHPFGLVPHLSRNAADLLVNTLRQGNVFAAQTSAICSSFVAALSAALSNPAPAVERQPVSTSSNDQRTQKLHGPAMRPIAQELHGPSNPGNPGQTVPSGQSSGSSRTQSTPPDTKRNQPVSGPGPQPINSRDLNPPRTPQRAGPERPPPQPIRPASPSQNQPSGSSSGTAPKPVPNQGNRPAPPTPTSNQTPAQSKPAPLQGTNRSGPNQQSAADAARLYPLGTMPGPDVDSGKLRKASAGKAIIECKGCFRRAEVERKVLGNVWTCPRCTTMFLASEIFPA